MANLFNVSDLRSVTVSDVNKTTTQGLTFNAKAKANNIQGQAKAMTFKAKAHIPQGQGQG